jgi:predicted lysophospholipase L1 biosynthesis ABC-type transport system permease subunit
MGVNGGLFQWAVGVAAVTCVHVPFALRPVHSEKHG